LSKSTNMNSFTESYESNNSNEAYPLGKYIVVHNVNIRESRDIRSPKVVKLHKGETVEVVEVKVFGSSACVRARIAEPAGWTSVVSTKGKQCLAPAARFVGTATFERIQRGEGPDGCERPVIGINTWEKMNAPEPELDEQEPQLNDDEYDQNGDQSDDPRDEAGDEQNEDNYDGRDLGQEEKEYAPNSHGAWHEGPAAQRPQEQPAAFAVPQAKTYTKPQAPVQASFMPMPVYPGVGQPQQMQMFQQVVQPQPQFYNPMVVNFNIAHQAQGQPVYYQAPEQYSTPTYQATTISTNQKQKTFGLQPLHQTYP